MQYAHPVTITVERTADDPVTGDPDPESTTTHTVDGCALAPRTSTEEQELGTQVVVGLTLFAPFGADIVSADIVWLPDDPEPWEVDGERGDWRSPFTDWHAGAQIALARHRGA